MTSRLSATRLSVAFIAGISAGKLLLANGDTRLMALSTSVFISIPIGLCLYLLLSKDTEPWKVDLTVLTAIAFTGMVSFFGGTDRHLVVPDVFTGLNRVMSSAVENSSLPAHGSFLKSITLGGTDISPDTRDVFSKTGIVHILSVSGLHVAYIALFIDILVRAVTKRKLISVFLMIVGISTYALISGASAPVLRAAIMSVCGLIARVIDRKTSLASAIAVSSLIILAVEPRALFTISFQLSYITALSVLYITPLIRTFLYNLLRNRSMPLLTMFIDSISISISATIGSFPILAYYFGEVSLISPLANLIAVPLSGAIVILGLLQTLLYFLIPQIALALGAANGLLIDGLLLIARELSALPWAQAVVPAPTLPVLLAEYSFLLWVLTEARPGYFEVKAIRSRKRLIYGFGIAIILVLWKVNVPSAGGAAVSFINVGQGDSILLRSSDNHYLLVDTGPIGNRPWKPDAGSRYVVPYLHRRGITKLDALILTHPDSDHIGGAASLLGKVEVDRIFVSSLTNDSEIYNHLLDSARSKKLPISLLNKGECLRIGQDLIIDTINPPQREASSLLTSDNDRAIVLMVHAGKKRLLLAADIEAEVENELIDDGEDLDCDILKVSHHGSKSSTTQRFVDATTPDTAVISVGHNNYGHPSPGVLQRLKRNGVRVWRTDINGDVTISLK